MKDLKHLFTALLLFCATVATAHNFEVDGIYYNILSEEYKTVEVTSGTNKYTSDVKIPEFITYNGTTYNVTSIGNYAFYNCTSLTSVVIGNSVTSIGNEAFSNCSGLTSIVIPNSVTSIGERAFCDCSGLTSIIVDGNNTKYDSRENCNAIIETETNTLIAGCKNTIIPNSVTSIGDNAFTWCNGLTSITIPNSVTSIGEGAFRGCSELTSVVIGNSVTSIGNEAFASCYGLTSITIPNSVTSIGDYAFQYCSGLTNVVIGNSVKSIGNYAFSNCSGLTNVVIGNSVTSIGNDAFYGTAWYNNQPDGVVYADKVLYMYKGTMPENTSITIKDGTLGIADYAFNDCTGLTSIDIPNSVTSIGEHAFSGCTGLTGELVIPNSVTSIGNFAFERCSGLASIVIGDGVTSIEEGAFYSCSGLTSITIPNSVTSIGKRAFYRCTGLKSVINFSNLTFSKGSSNNGYVAYYADDVYNAPNGSIEGDFIFGKPNDVNTLLYYLGNATKLTLPANYKGENYVIGNEAFYECTSLTSVVIGNSVTSIGNQAFYRCTGLKSVINFSNLTFSKGSSNNGYVAYYADDVYNAPNGSIEGDFIFGKPNDVNTLLYYLGNATKLTLPANYKGENYVIGNEAFYECTSLTSVVIGNSVTSIGNQAFYRCTGLKSVINFSNLTFSKGSSNNGYVAYYADDVYNAPNGSIEGDFIFGKPNDVNTLLYYLGNATELILPADYKGENYAIGTNVFKDNTTITSISIPNSVTSIGKYAFYGCTCLTSISIPNSVTSIGDYALRGCAGLTSIVIPNSVTSIGNYVFNGCTSLKELRIEDGESTLFLGYNTYNSSDTGKGLFCDCPLEALYLGRNLSYNTGTSCGYSPFNNIKTLTSVTIGNGVTSIERNEFYGCSGLTCITIPNSVTSIGEHAFSYCSGFKTVINFSKLTFSKGSNSYGYVAYYANKVYNAPNGYVEDDFILGEPNGVNTLVGYLGNATEPTLPADYRGEDYVIGESAFSGSKTLTSVVIPNSVTSIGSYAFSGCSSLSNIDFYNGITDIGASAFKDCVALTRVDIVNGVKTVGASAFAGCSNVETLYISNTIESIGDQAFAECNNIFDIKIGSKKAITASENIFSSDAYNNACLYVPTGRKFAYEKTTPWNNFYIMEMDFTGIDEVKGEDGKVEGVYYDLSGRVVENPTNGVYIINGKKMLVK